ncbi:fumarylacetoacetate hydrolase family protein [Saccharibacillus alkalitolerans]|uniref:Fumarylacetoacetate hydrolase family protein n=1 Tax=Saccharibacillus alkalitolerans TaxID=2705290 RepID=A0ABX0F3J1_9BACL|nr:fumarylacetoacetate hydrolase family protein [Saccharibacillus alkalitolerans]NGZ74445.1 fumarylacetoacetate hydrolase family protein [Saccharibacillus alkalitolerans]
MKLSTIEYEGCEQAAFLTERGLIPLAGLNEREGSDWDTEIFELLRSGRMEHLRRWYAEGGKERLIPMPVLPAGRVRYRALYRTPGKIIGVGMNYLAKAIELSGRPPEDEPVIFLKPNTSLIGPGETILLPPAAGRVTAEAELAIVIGKTCRGLAEEEAMRAVAGVTASLDMTAKDIHARNPRFMQRAKSFDTFLSLGASFSTLDEYPDLAGLEVATVRSGSAVHRDTVGRMIFSPAYLVSFLSHIMTLHPGDVILTGTPGSVTVEAGDEAECRIEGLETLKNPVGLSPF